MALISIIQDFHPLTDSRLLQRAQELLQVLHHDVRYPLGAFRLKQHCGREREELPVQHFSSLSLGKGEDLCLDFGEHLVGHVTLEFSFSGSHPDAPAFIKLQFAESDRELYEDSRSYAGWLSGSWIQEEVIHVDELPAHLTLPRRYAFRYLRITVLDTSPKYKLVVKQAECLTESSADPSALSSRRSAGDARLDAICDVSLKTLSECMQEVFEDGPKRDRRLWIGDLRLQALTNYVSFKNYDLVKRCLYLFGGNRFPDGRVSACLFTKPSVEADDTFLLDYALMYTVSLEEYLQETQDTEALNDLYEIAMQQVDYALSRCAEDDLLDLSAIKDAFIDWGDTLDKAACIQGVLIYALDYACRLAERKQDGPRARHLRMRQNRLREAAFHAFWSDGDQCFLSNGQLSAATQVWMTLADAASPEKTLSAMKKALSLVSAEPKMETPYMHHCFVMALLHAKLREEAVDHLKAYWGGMIDAGADTFWECWDGEDPDRSPYGGSIVNSYCHAWSCTPAYIIDRFLT